MLSRRATINGYTTVHYHFLLDLILKQKKMMNTRYKHFLHARCDSIRVAHATAKRAPFISTVVVQLGVHCLLFILSDPSGIFIYSSHVFLTCLERLEHRSIELSPVVNPTSIRRLRTEQQVSRRSTNYWKQEWTRAKGLTFDHDWYA
jgi:hypothetical protein